MSLEKLDSLATPSNTSMVVAAVKLPEFWPADPEIWFEQCEAQFRLHRITQERTKKDHIVSRLPPDTIRLVRDLIGDTADDAYTKIRKRLLDLLTPSRSKQINEAISAELSAKRPSIILMELRSSIGDQIRDGATTLLRELLLAKLPPAVRRQLALLPDSTTIEEFAARGDAIVQANLDHQDEPSAPISDEVADLRAQVAALAAQLNSRPPSFQRPRYRSPSPRYRSQVAFSPRNLTRRQETDWCFYHQRFREKARKCSSPCGFRQEGNSNGRR